MNQIQNTAKTKAGTHPKPTAARTDSPSSAISILWKGVCMGGADIVPGVSGGTVALILGIYERLLTALSRCDMPLLQLAFRRQWRPAAQRIDLGFLLLLATGILVGMVGCASTVSRLLSDAGSRPYVLSIFFGMILASAILVSRLIETGFQRMFVPWTAGMLFAFYLSGLPQINHQPNPVSLLLCGAFAICAMLLPGISGAMILVLLGAYEHLIEIPNALASGERISANLTELISFGIGCALGLVVFSKLLRWLLKCHAAITMATLCGFMFGALRKLWPFQIDRTPELQWKRKQFEPYLPDSFDTQQVGILIVGAVAGILVLGIGYRVQQQRSSSTHPVPPSNL